MAVTVRGYLYSENFSNDPQELDVAIRQGNEASQTSVLERCKSESSFSAEDFVKAAQLCQFPKRRFLATAKAALTAALQKFTAQDSPPYDTVAQVCSICLSAVGPPGPMVKQK